MDVVFSNMESLDWYGSYEFGGYGIEVTIVVVYNW
jgi:hypothetical protein